MNLSTIFTRHSAPARLALEEEVALVEAVKAGDDAAFVRLAETYAPRLRAAASAARFSLPDDEERQQVTLFAFLTAVHATAPGERVASVVKFKMTDAMREAASGARSGVSVPHETAKRYFGIVALAGGDVDAAEALATTRGMSPETFRDVRAAVQAPDSVEALNHDSAGASKGGARKGRNGSTVEARLAPTYEPVSLVTSVENSLLSAQALAALDETERAVVTLSYGFDGGDPVPDAQIAERLGMNRTTAWKVKQRALSKMRAALAV